MHGEERACENNVPLGGLARGGLFRDDRIGKALLSIIVGGEGQTAKRRTKAWGTKSVLENDCPWRRGFDV